MKVVILAGGFGTRITEESIFRPKPMIEVGGKPILWHIMKEYSYYGFNEFIICAGYKQQVIKEYFNNYYLYNSDVTFDFSDRNNRICYENIGTEPWKVTIVDTGLNTMTGGRIKRIRKYLGEETFMLTYGDGVSDIDLRKEYEFHKQHGKLATVASVDVPQQFGGIGLGKGGKVSSFREKSSEDMLIINGGYMILEPQVIDLIDGDTCVWERGPMSKLVEMGELMSYHHFGFWKCMDTRREREQLEEIWESGKAPWKKWQD